ncbi:hypothetical protein RhiJN_18680 [Ceratobasidium sp. AG-Ba]|nr:hypothetical protein RhiJN_18680 [Ceratobasidium sp. AG-Ba]
MSEPPYDQQPRRSSDIARLYPPRPIEDGATVVAHAIAPPPWLSPPSYRGLTPGPPGYPAPPPGYPTPAAQGPTLPPLRALGLPPSLNLVRRADRPPLPALYGEGAPGPGLGPAPMLRNAPEPSNPRREPNPAPHSPTDTDTEPEPELETKAYTVLVTLEWTELVQPRSGARNRPSKETKRADSKPIDMEITLDTSWSAFTHAMLRAHDLEHKYRTSESHGFSIRINWRGSPGGAKLPCTVDDRHGWARIRPLIIKKAPGSTPVFVSFRADDLQRFRVRTRDEPDEGFDDDENDNLRHKVARVGNAAQVSDVHVLHGRTILDLESRWQCPVHRGEHGEQGHCYRPTSDSTHVQLNMRRKKIWAAAIHAGTASLEVPPDMPEFTPATNPIGLAPSRSRRTAPVASSSNEVGNIVSSIVAPITAGLFGVMSAMAGTPNAPPPAPVAPTPRVAAPAFDLGYSVRTPPPIPNPTPEALISACLDSFHQHSGIDLSTRKGYLTHNLLTPKLIMGVPFDHLLGKLHIPEGHAVQFWHFCAEWDRKYNRGPH